MDAALAAGVENRYDVGVMHLGGGFGFILEAAQLPGVQHGSEGQHLESDFAAERHLLRFVNHSHATPTDLADNAKIAQRQFRLQGGQPSRAGETGCVSAGRRYG